MSSKSSDVSYYPGRADIAVQIELERNNDIQYRTCSWQKTAGLLFSEYICLAIMSFPYSYSILGLVPGILLTIAVAGTVLYTSLVLWRFCLEHPEVKDVCDIGEILFPWSKWSWHATAVMFILNNTFIQALHCLVGAKLLNTLSGGAECTVIFSVLTAIVCFVVSLPRTLSQLSSIGVFSAVTMGIAVVLSVVFVVIQDHPFGYVDGKPPIFTLFPAKGTTFVAGMSAFLNITYTFVGQITLPSFIAEMKNPLDFPKALWAVTLAELVVFTVCGAVMYAYTGARAPGMATTRNQYVTSPAFGSLQPLYKKIAFAFAIPTIIFLGSLYASVSARLVFFHLFANSHHRHSHTFRGWATWAGILGATWVAAFALAELVPFFSALLSVMSALFDSWFGFIFWGTAYMTLYPGNAKWAGHRRALETAANGALIILGVFILGPGIYVSVQSIVDAYREGDGGRAFSCASNAV